jgi:hypothetical protein
LESSESDNSVVRCFDDISDIEKALSQCTDVLEEIIKFSHFSKDVSFKVFLKKRRLPPKIDAKIRRKFAAHHEYDDVEWFPYVLACHDGMKVVYEVMEPSGRFSLKMKDGWKATDFTDEEKELFGKGQLCKRFQISKSVYLVAPLLETNSENVDYFKEVEHDGLTVFKEIKEQYLYQLDIQEWCATLMALWTMMTHMYQIWNSIPYFFFLAERGSGKSTALYVMSVLSSMGQYWVSPRPSPLFRAVDILQPTLFLDETEMLNEDDQAEINNLLNAGYQKGAKVPRTNTEKMVVEFFDAYCPKALASTTPPNPTLESRCLKIPLNRTKHPEIYVQRTPTHRLKSLKDLNLKAAFWSIEQGAAVAGYDPQTIFTKYASKFEGAPARALEIMVPLLSIYELLDLENEGEAENLAKIIEYQAQEQKTQSINEADQRVIVALWELVNSSEITITTKSIIKTILGCEPGSKDENGAPMVSEAETKFYNPQRIGGILKTLHVPVSTIDGRKQYMRKMTLDERFLFIKDLLESHSIEVSSVKDAVDKKPAGQQSIDVERLNTKKGALF